MHCWGGGAAMAVSSGMTDGSLVTIVNHFYNSRYESIDIEELPDGVIQGYSAVLNLHLRWEQGRLAWHDPATAA